MSEHRDYRHACGLRPARTRWPRYRPGQGAGAAAFAFATMAVPTIAGCTTVEIRSGTDEVRIERGFGVISIDPGTPAGATLTRVRGVGLVSTPLAATAGYATHDLAMLGDDCRVIFWVERRSTVEALEPLAATLPDACMAIPADEGHDHDDFTRDD